VGDNDVNVVTTFTPMPHSTPGLHFEFCILHY